MEVGFEEFAAVETARLFGLARVLCGNHHDNMAAYARKTLANLHKNWHRRRREVLLADPLDPAAPEEPGPLSLDAWLDTAMRSLPHRQRVAVALTYLEDRPIREVAEILGCGVATAKTHLARGRVSLRRAAEAA